MSEIAQIPAAGLLTGPPPTAATASTAGEEEISRVPFTVDDEKNIRQLATWMSATGLVLVGSGVLEMVNYLSSMHPFGLIGWVFKVIVGAWTLQSALALKRVVTTAGASQNDMVLGLRGLRHIFMALVVYLVVMLAMLCASFLVIVLAAFENA